MIEVNSWVLASHNKSKIKEISDLLAPQGINLQSAADFSLSEPEETESTFSGNALLKARAAAEVTNRPALADDSGLCVAALDGRPGIHSARWAGQPRDFMRAMQRIEEELTASGMSDRSAAFICVLALVFPDGQEHLYEGRADGQLVWPPRGSGGFGYDPIFQPAGESRVFSEMTPSEKAHYSHRAKALKKLMAAQFGTG